MAAMAVDNAPPSGGGPERLPVPSRNPLPLSASQEAQVRDVFYARVRRHCAEEIKGGRASRRSFISSLPLTLSPC